MRSEPRRYGLLRGREWVESPLLSSPSLTGDPARAWSTTSLDLALERSGLLRLMPGGWATQVRALP